MLYFVGRHEYTDDLKKTDPLEIKSYKTLLVSGINNALTNNWLGLRSSITSDCVREKCTPSSRCRPQHSRQIRTPRLVESQSGSNKCDANVNCQFSTIMIEYNYLYSILHNTRTLYKQMHCTNTANQVCLIWLRVCLLGAPQSQQTSLPGTERTAAMRRLQSSFCGRDASSSIVDMRFAWSDGLEPWCCSRDESTTADCLREAASE